MGKSGEAVRSAGGLTRSSTYTRARPDLSALLAPRSIALVGASADPKSIGSQPLRYMKTFGYEGQLYPVNPKRTEIQGVRCYESVLSIAKPCDVAVVTVAAARVPGVIRECGQAGIPFAVVLSAGFEETGAGGAALQKDLKDAIDESGVRVVGPNSTGVVNLLCRSYCGQGGALSDPRLQPGSVAIVSQSGGVGLSMLAFAQSAGIGTSYFISSGNEVDLDAFDMVEYLLELTPVSAIALYLESTVKGRRLRALGRRALALAKPIVVLNVGGSGTAREAASSHTGRLTARHELFRTAFCEGGYVEAADLDEVVDMLSVLRAPRRPQGKRAAILTTSGGWGVMMAERCEQYGLQLPALSGQTTEALGRIAPSYASVRNPVDVTPQSSREQYAAYSQLAAHLLADEGVDISIVRSATGGDLNAWAESMMQVARECTKPLYVNWAPPPGRFEEVKTLLEAQGVPCISYAGRLARAIAAAAHFERRVKDASAVGATASTDATAIRIPLALPTSAGAMSEHESKKCLRAYDIRTTHEMLIREEELDHLRLGDFTFPVAVKIASPDVLHKTEAGGVMLGLSGVDNVKAAGRSILAHTRAHFPQARIDGLLVQEMASGLEVILGAASDPHFGPYVMFGIGGIYAEVLKDVTYRFAPFNEQTAREMLSEVKGADLLRGVRGEAARDQEALAKALVNFSRLIDDHRDQIAEIEINPLFVGRAGEGVVAADGLVIVK